MRGCWLQVGRLRRQCWLLPEPLALLQNSNVSESTFNVVRLEMSSAWQLAIIWVTSETYAMQMSVAIT